MDTGVGLYGPCIFQFIIFYDNVILIHRAVQHVSQPAVLYYPSNLWKTKYKVAVYLLRCMKFMDEIIQMHSLTL